MALVSTLVAKKSGPISSHERANGYFYGTYTAATVNSATAASTTAVAATGGIANSDAVANQVVAAGVMTITLGFVPTHVHFHNVTARTSIDWYQGMLAGNVLTTDVNGVQALSTGSIFTVSATTGVVVFTFSGQLTDNETLVWFAEA